MQPLAPREVLDLWERGRQQHPVDRALTLVSAVHLEVGRDELARWSLGRRDRALLALSCASFGPRLAASGDCPACRAAVDLEVDVAGLLELAAGGESQDGGEVAAGGRSVRFRFPNSLDLAAVAGLAEPTVARGELLRRCLGAGPEGEAIDPSEELAAAVAAAIEEADPLTEAALVLDCPDCGQRWTEDLDVGAFAWAHVVAAAEWLLWEVDRLASAYGWSEEEILALSSGRRRWYVEAVG